MNKEVKNEFPPKPEKIAVLDEAIRLQKRKGQDYQNVKSRIRHADHYPNGVQTIMDMVYQKVVRIYSLMEATQAGQKMNIS